MPQQRRGNTTNMSNHSDPRKPSGNNNNAMITPPPTTTRTYYTIGSSTPNENRNTTTNQHHHSKKHSTPPPRPPSPSNLTILDDLQEEHDGTIAADDCTAGFILNDITGVHSNHAATLVKENSANDHLQILKDLADVNHHQRHTLNHESGAATMTGTQCGCWPFSTSTR